MIQIRPVSDLRNKFPEIEKAVGGGNPVYLTKNGYGAMFVLSLDAYQSGFLEGTTPTSDKIMEVRRFLYTISGTVIGPSKAKRSCWKNIETSTRTFLMRESRKKNLTNSKRFV